MERYTERARKAGRAMGLSRVTVREIPDSTGPRRADMEGANILSRRARGPLIALDERGKQLDSAAFARYFQSHADLSRDLTFAIGVADGHGDAVRAEADSLLSLGPMTLPHLLARVVLCEQIYRAVTLCVGHPYHRA